MVAVGFKFRAFGASLGGLLVWRGVRTVSPASAETSLSAAEHHNFDNSKEFDGSADNLTRGRGPTGRCREVARRAGHRGSEYGRETGGSILRARFGKENGGGGVGKRLVHRKRIRCRVTADGQRGWFAVELGERGRVWAVSSVFDWA